MSAMSAFTFDARYCSGCKACQAACKDKNQLPPGVLWRRVIEVSGGAWLQQDGAWQNTVFAYHLSLSCNHCVHPKCAGVCPTKAYSILENGIVFLEPSKCVGCGYCAWACPYGAPQYDPSAGHMTKCDLCVDDLEAGLPPACVAACPMRGLEYGKVTSHRELRLWDVPPSQHPFPLPADSRTEPRLAIKPHPAMQARVNKYVANPEEIQLRKRSSWEEAPLILFTLLGQLAVGSLWAMLWLFSSVWTEFSHKVTFLSLLPLLFVGSFLGAGMFASLAHLGTKRNAWRTLANLRKSWLSREILFTLLFGLGWSVALLEMIVQGRVNPETLGITATLGFGLVYGMAQVYRLRTIPSWNTQLTNLGFVITASLLGETFMAVLLSRQETSGQWIMIGLSALILLLVELGLTWADESEPPFRAWRAGLIAIGLILAIGITLLPILQNSGIGVVFFLVVLAEEILGRWSFYHFRTRSVLSS